MLRLKTDNEKCSTWIKLAVNENLLGSYIATIDQDKSLLSNHYYEYAFLRDPVMVDTVKSLLNYGIANFDFQITISENHPNQLTKQGQEAPVCFDAFGQTKKNGYDSPKLTEPGLTSTEETWSSKKKRKKKKTIKTVFIEDQNDFTEPEDTESTEPEDTEVKNISEITTMGIPNLKKEEIFTRIHEDDKLLKNGDNVVKPSLATTDQSDFSTVGDVRANNLDTMDSSSNCHVTNTTANGNNASIADNQSNASESNNQRTRFASNQLDEYFILQQNPEINSRTKKRNQELDSLGRIEERSSPRQEFSANDFLLDDTEPENVSITDSNLTHSKDYITRRLKDNSKHDSTQRKIENTSVTKTDYDLTNFQKSCTISDSTCEVTLNLQKSEKDTSGVLGTINKGRSSTDDEFMEISSNSRNELFSSSPKSQTTHTPGISGGNMKKRSDTNEELSETPKSRTSSNSQKSETRRIIGRKKECTVTNDEFSESLGSPHTYDYRVRRVENPEFVSSSYGSSSALSDITDDDRDLNFIPGIHKLSSRSFSSSLERRNTFDENGLPIFESSHYTESSSSQPSSIDDGSSRFGDMSNEWDMFEDLLNVEEEHFSKPDNFAGLTTSEELEMAIEHYKKMIKMRKEKSQQRDDLVQKLVKLRLRLQHERDGPPVENPKFRKILSHQFSKKESTSGTKYFCDQCGKNIWTIWQSLFTCNDCGYHSHRKCLEHIQRPCANKNLSSASYILDICPDAGLDAQQYRCAECRKEIAFSKDDVAEARICDYTGQYYCDNCHWNDQISTPARVLRNWDFTQHKVCRKTKQLLELMKTRPILDLQQINPMLYRYVEELREVGKLREDILIMKKYFLTCREALESKLLIQLQKRQHFVDSAHTYSFQDLVDLNSDVLLPEISKIHSLFLAHIKADCELCRARGFICEVCRDSGDIIFAFDPHTVKCSKCSAVFHKICFKPEDCPKCERKKKTSEET